MVFNIYDDNRYYPLIDIENYYRLNEYDNKHYQSINVHICAEGYSKFMIKHYEDFKNEQMLKLFLKDLKEILELGFKRAEYWSREPDYPKRKNDETYIMDESYYVEDKIREVINPFCDKWNLNITGD